VRSGGVESGDELGELLLVLGSDGDEVSTLSSLGLVVNETDTSDVLQEELCNERILRLGEGGDEIVGQRIFVLVEPLGSLVLYVTSIVGNTESSLGESRLDVLWMSLGVELSVQLVDEGKIGGLREEGFFIEKGQDTHRFLFDEINGWLQVKSEIDECPLDSFLLVLLLLEGKHVVVEELLELLIGEVDAELLKAVDLEDFETGDIEHTDEGAGLLSSELLVDLLDDPQEESVVQRLGKGLSGVSSLLRVQVGWHVFVTSTNSRLADGLIELASINFKDARSSVQDVAVFDGRSLTE
jgi:hypothetical protein